MRTFSGSLVPGLFLIRFLATCERPARGGGAEWARDAEAMRRRRAEGRGGMEIRRIEKKAVNDVCRWEGNGLVDGGGGEGRDGLGRGGRVM